MKITIEIEAHDPDELVAQLKKFVEKHGQAPAEAQAKLHAAEVLKEAVASPRVQAAELLHETLSTLSAASSEDLAVAAAADMVLAFDGKKPSKKRKEPEQLPLNIEPQLEAPKQEAPVYTLPDEVKNAANMRDLLIYLVDQIGIKDLELLVTEVEKLKGQVPMLDKIANIPERVRRVAVLLDLVKA